MSPRRTQNWTPARVAMAPDPDVERAQQPGIRPPGRRKKKPRVTTAPNASSHGQPQRPAAARRPCARQLGEPHRHRRPSRGRPTAAPGETAGRETGRRARSRGARRRRGSPAGSRRRERPLAAPPGRTLLWPDTSIEYTLGERGHRPRTRGKRGSAMAETLRVARLFFVLLVLVATGRLADGDLRTSPTRRGTTSSASSSSPPSRASTTGPSPVAGWTTGSIQAAPARGGRWGWRGRS